VSLTRTAPAGPAQQAPAAPPGLPDQPGARSPMSRLSAAIRSWSAGTPGRMRLLLLAGAVVAIVFGFAASQGFSETSGALERADANAAQLVRIQAIHTNLARADADATNAFLRGGLEPPEQRDDYVAATSDAGRLIADAARAQPADNEALAALNKEVLEYIGLIEQARANNRQGLPVGAQYLRVASSGLRADALPILQKLVEANEQRVTLEFDRIVRGFVWLSVAGLVALAAFAGLLLWLARRTRRYVNVPVAIGGVAVLLTTIVGATRLSDVGNEVDDVRDEPYRATLALAQARIAAYDAKSNESLTLISRGSGKAFDDAWKASSAIVAQRLNTVTQLYFDADTRALPGDWTAYTGIHQQIRQKDDRGQWDQAVQQAIGDDQTSANAAFRSFDTASAEQLARTGEQTRSDLADAGNLLPLGRWLCLLVGLGAALCVFWGFSQRLEEYR
jgi:hypothetical protein